MSARTPLMDLYIRALEGWPQETAEAAGAIIAQHAQEAYTDIRAGYPVVTGTLRDGLTLRETSRSAMAPSWTLENPVFYAKIFESGSASVAGGTAGPGRVFVPISIRKRRAMRAAIVELLQESAPRG